MKMWLALIESDGQGKERRTFSCPVCEISNGESNLLQRGTRMAI